MGHPSTIPIDPEMREAIITRTAEILADRAQAELGTLDRFILIKTPTVAQMFGVTRQYIGRKFQTHAINDRETGVLLADIKTALGQ